jgi:hypothetical protein
MRQDVKRIFFLVRPFWMKHAAAGACVSAGKQPLLHSRFLLAPRPEEWRCNEQKRRYLSFRRQVHTKAALCKLISAARLLKKHTQN